MNDTATERTSNDLLRWILIGGLVVAAFFGAYKFAAAMTAGVPLGPAVVQQQAAPAAGTQQQVTTTADNPVVAPTPSTGGAAAGQGGGACCGNGSGSSGACCGGSGQPTANGVTGAPIEGTAKSDGDVQRITVRVVNGAYSPNVVRLKAGVPADITFAQSSGCTGVVQSADLDFTTDVSGGPQTIRIDDPQAGTYGFACGMNMTHGKIVVE